MERMGESPQDVFVLGPGVVGRGNRSPRNMNRIRRTLKFSCFHSAISAKPLYLRAIMQWLTFMHLVMV
jgi:hypothetical protein